MWPHFSISFLLCAEILEIFIKNNRDIKGIFIYGIEYKLSQYADDTSLVLDGSSKFTDGILRVWDYFADLSGLKINYTKTKIVWIWYSLYLTQTPILQKTFKNL